MSTSLGSLSRVHFQATVLLRLCQEGTVLDSHSRSRRCREDRTHKPTLHSQGTHVTMIGSCVQTFLEKIKTLYTDTPGLSPDKIGPTVGQNSAFTPVIPALSSIALSADVSRK